MKKSFFVFLLFAIVSFKVWSAEAASADTDKLNVSFGGYIDAYYGLDFNNPPNYDRAYGPGVYHSTFSRNNEMNVNLAFVEAKISNSAEDVRGRIALQAGTEVQSVYVGEPTTGNISGPNLSRNIQEASVGYKLADHLWLDAGIYPSHIGSETFITKDNWTYTRSLLVEFSPFYQSGIKLSYEFSKAWSGQLHLINGWQNVAESNNNKALGAQVVFAPSEQWTFTENTYFGQETPAGTSAYLNRDFSDFIVNWNPSGPLSFSLAYDIGIQMRADYSGYDTFWGASLQGKDQLNEKTSLVARIERYSDPRGVLVPLFSGAQSTNGFSAWGASVTLNRQLKKYLLWRAELRSLWSSDSIFVNAYSFSTSDLFAVTSIALSF